MKALVTGGGGFLGLYIVEQLVERGDSVRVFCRGSYDRLNELGVETVQGDIRDAEAVSTACEGVDVVFHVAAVPGVWGPWKHYYEINTLGTEHVIAGCRANSVTRLIYTSSPSVVFDGHPHIEADESLPYPEFYLCHYPHTKALAERAVLEANRVDQLLTASLRPHLIWGPRDNHLVPRLIQSARSGRVRQVGDGENVISMAYVENVAAAHLQAADALTVDSPVAGQAYFINEPEPVPLWRWINELLALAGLPPVERRISATTARRIGATLERVYRLLRLPGEPPMTRFVASQLSQSHSYSIAKAERDFGYSPQISIEEGMRRIEPELAELVKRSR
ncbi:MAG: NAD-dependent epimerase/dehydratase family protein [Planctomycetaceae bacterium]|nr:NAD-dependent epimerase/dehydratase family protein [Planctomycetaceae bacterium]